MKKKWKNLIVLCLAATLTCFLPVRIAEAEGDNGSLSSGVSAEGNSNLVLEAAPEENCNLPLGGGGEENNNPPAEEKLEFVDIRENITYLSDISFQVKGSPTKVTIKKEDGNEEATELSAESGNTYKVTVDGKKGTYIITAEKESQKISCKVKINGGKDDGKIVLSSGTYALTTGQAYKLESGFGGKPWRVEGEGNHTVYYGGCSFYVSEAKDYHITTAGWGVW